MRGILMSRSTTNCSPGVVSVRQSRPKQAVQQFLAVLDAHKIIEEARPFEIALDEAGVAVVVFGENDGDGRGGGTHGVEPATVVDFLSWGQP